MPYPTNIANGENADINEKPSKESVPLLFSCRLTMCIMAFLGCLINYILRFNLGFAIVCMSLDNKIQSNTSEDDECLQYHYNSSTIEPGITLAEFDWAKSLQGLILAAYFYGYLITQIPSGWLCEKYGPKIVFIIGIGVTSVLAFLIPESSRLTPHLLIALRVLQGLFGATLLPSVHSLISKWATPNERAFLLSLAYSGLYIGNMTTFPFSALLCKHGFAGGWPSIFYVSGLIGLIWLIGAMYFIYDDYEQHPRISIKEKMYLQNAGIGNFSEHTNKKKRIPWIKFLKSPAVWAIAIAHLAANWGLYTMVINLPSYMDDVHKFKIKENGFFSALPYLSLLVVTLLGGKLSDFLIKKKAISVTAVRKTFNSAGMFIPSFCMFLLTFLNCTQRFYAVAVVFVMQAFIGFAYSGGYFINHVDIAPQFAGVLMGISNVFGTVPGIASPMIIGFLTPNGTLSEWSTVFYIGVATYIIGGLSYLILGSGEEQNWSVDANDLPMVELQPKIKEKNGGPI